MKMHALVTICALVVLGISVSAANDPADEKAVMATLEAMAKATLAKDVKTLARIYGEDVTEFMKFSETTIRIYGNVALVKGITDFRNGQPGKMLDNHLNILWVMVKRPEGPHGWQIVARQTTRVGPSSGTPVPAK